MAISIGIDIGAISVKIGIVGAPSDRARFSYLTEESLFPEVSTDEPFPYAVMQYTRVKGKPIETTRGLLRQLDRVLQRMDREIQGIRVCGTGGALLLRHLRGTTVNEFAALTKGVEFVYPAIRTVFEMGGNTSRYLLLEEDPGSHTLGLMDYNQSGDCAAGTGSFLDQQASRMKFRIEEVGEIVADCTRSAKIAGRCSVFAKSDMIHAQQKGYQPDEILKGLCEAVARNFKSNIVSGKKVQPPVAFLGGVAANQGVVNALRTIYQFHDDELVVPPLFTGVGALGAAVLEQESPSNEEAARIGEYFQIQEPGDSEHHSFSGTRPLRLDKVILLRDRLMKQAVDQHRGPIPAFLGIDVGSVSTNLAVIDNEGTVLKEIYFKTEGRPIEIVNRGLHEIEEELGDTIRIKGVGTTGSGRELIGKLVGADTINDEITAHKTGADYIAKQMLGTKVDTIFEVGGQDSKFIRLEEGIVVDFTMNEACAAGTGSFLEERAEELEINIQEQFAELALSSSRPIKLGERCTVFMERDVTSSQQKGIPKADLVAGLAYSVVYNYLNRVVRGRKIGEVIFFQGGTAYNNAVAAAFARVLDKTIIVPPYNGVIGAIGVALLARDKMNRTSSDSAFRGYALEHIDYALREFTCKACSNYCNMQVFTVEDESTYWGDQCSDKFRTHARDGQKAHIEDLFKLRQEYLFEGFDPEDNFGSTTIGIPHCMYFYEWLPFWQTYLTELGFQVRFSPPTNKKIKYLGQESTVAEPCFPIAIAHGHIMRLFLDNVDFVLVPNMISAESKDPQVNSYFCPWGQTLPFIARHAPSLQDYQHRLLYPNMEFQFGVEVARRALYEKMRSLEVSWRQSNNAFAHAMEAQRVFTRKLKRRGEQALRQLESLEERGIVVAGRPYNIYDSAINIDIPRKIRDYYGVNLIPYDFLDVGRIGIRDINENMFWSYGQRILALAKYVDDRPNLDLIYLTNFKCGPDSFIKHFLREALGRPFLTLQFDEHSNDAGYLTRCEAYLTSKGLICGAHG